MALGQPNNETELPLLGWFSLGSDMDKVGCSFDLLWGLDNLT